MGALNMAFLSLLVLVVFVGHAKSLTEKEAMNYLWNYRHVNNKGNNVTSSSLNSLQYSEGLKNFQRYTQIPVTGLLDSATKEMMKTPRCFNPNNDTSMDRENRVKRYDLYDRKWFVRNLTYHMLYPYGVDRNIIDNGLRQAFDMWTKYSGIGFTKAARMNAHIKMRFDYIETPETLGYAYFPPVGVIVFSTRFTWTENSKQGENFFRVALHEIGHALGLRHTNVKDATLFPFLGPYVPNFKLHDDDIDGIAALYK